MPWYSPPKASARNSWPRSNMLALFLASFPFAGACHVKAMLRLTITRLVGKAPFTEAPMDAGAADEEAAASADCAPPVSKAATPAGRDRALLGVTATGVVVGLADEHAGWRHEGPLG